ncbi:MAG TPA: exosortase F system-associated protein [Aequorivita sp.]|nr:exosortase F system-associated protein [Aequorivita sp.]
MRRKLKIFGILIFVSLLVLIRGFEEQLFYDPLLQFFKRNYKTMPLPDMDIVKLHVGVAFRYLLNTLLSLAILWLAFWNKEIIKISIYLYIILFVLFFVAFGFIVADSGEGGDHLLLFYIRRFLIHPLFLLILIPAFYFQKYKSR